MRPAWFCCAVLLVALVMPAFSVASDVTQSDDKWALPGHSVLKLGRAQPEQPFRPRLSVQDSESETLAEQETVTVSVTPTLKPAASSSVRAKVKPPEKREVTQKSLVKSTPLAPTKVISPVDGRLVPGVVLMLKLASDPALSGPLTLAADGTALVPLLGRLKLSGKTLPEAEAYLRSAYADGFYVKPELTLTLRDDS